MVEKRKLIKPQFTWWYQFIQPWYLVWSESPPANSGSCTGGDGFFSRKRKRQLQCFRRQICRLEDTMFAEVEKLRISSWPEVLYMDMPQGYMGHAWAIGDSTQLRHMPEAQTEP
uniref:Uncharacterized protein n=1 Tax=Leersia perrieri TaxID=77586 RepID=A0A0D9XFC5_9ORYZ